MQQLKNQRYGKYLYILKRFLHYIFLHSHVFLCMFSFFIWMHREWVQCQKCLLCERWSCPTDFFYSITKFIWRATSYFFVGVILFFNFFVTNWQFNTHMCTVICVIRLLLTSKIDRWTKMKSVFLKSNFLGPRVCHKALCVQWKCSLFSLSSSFLPSSCLSQRPLNT